LRSPLLRVTAGIAAAEHDALPDEAAHRRSAKDRRIFGSRGGSQASQYDAYRKGENFICHGEG
jgi:hypothetical protein